MLLRKMNVVAALVALVPFAIGCGSDDPSGPGGGGGGGGGDKDLAPGMYQVTFDTSICPVPGSGHEATGGGPSVFTVVLCDDASWEELLDIDCNGVDVVGDNLTIDCSYTDSDGGCTTTYRIQGSGSKSGNTWTLNGTQTITSETPQGCSGNNACEQAMITVELIQSGAPTACSYADAMTVENTVGGGPNPGKFVMRAGGQSTPQGNNTWFWGFGGYYNSSETAKSNRNLSSLDFVTPLIDGTSLPATFPLAAQGFAKASAGDPVFMSYYEQLLSGSSFFSESVDQGTITINEVSDDHIAGTYSCTVSGTQFTPPSTSVPGSRTLSGGFFVIGGEQFKSSFTVDYVSDKPLWPGLSKAFEMSRQ